MAPTKMKLRMRKKDGAGKVSQAVSTEASPDSKCPICLDRFNNMAYLDRCLHKFCFRCIHEWSKNKAECPLCKQPFNSIFHSIKAENDFKEFVLRPTENGSFGSPEGRRFRYRTTQTWDRRQSQRRASPPPENVGVLEGLAASVPLQQDTAFQRVMSVMAARRRAQSEGRTARHLREQEMVSFRRALYRTGVRVRSVRDGGRYRDISATFFQRNPACLHRLLPWLRRELIVLYGSHGSLVNIVQHIIMSRITRYNMEDQAIQDELRPFLLTRTDHFLHEFISFARSPFNMEAYDQHAVYDCPAPSYEEGSSSDSSVIAISEDEVNFVDLSQQPRPAEGSALSQTPWDDETPGPSYSTTEQTEAPLASTSESESASSRERPTEARNTQQQNTQVKNDPTVNNNGAVSSGEDDCVIVGYVKPMAERTPELVQLSSDSEESVQPESTDVPQESQSIRFPSLSPPSSICSSVSKHKSPQRRELSAGSSGPDRPNWTPSDPEHRCSSSKEDYSEIGTDGAYSRDKYQVIETDTPSRDDKRRQSVSRSGECSRSRSKERSRRSHSRRSRSTEQSWSVRSPTVSVNSDSTLSRDRRCSRSHSRERLLYKDGSRTRRRDRHHSRSRRSRDRSYSYSWEFYRHYSRERERTDAGYGQDRSWSSSLYSNPSYGAHSQRHGSPRESHHRERRRSRSQSSTSSRGSHSLYRSCRDDKPGGKRKYKTRHLEDASKERSSRHASSSSSVREKRGSGERHHKKSHKRKSRSPSVEIIFEGRATGESRRHHKKKKKHKRKSRRHRSVERPLLRSPTVITIDSDSDHADTSPLPPTSMESHPPGSTALPGDTSLLESILQDLEQHVLSIDTNSSMDIRNSEVTFEGNKDETLQTKRDERPLPSGGDTGTGLSSITEQGRSLNATDSNVASCCL